MHYESVKNQIMAKITQNKDFKSKFTTWFWGLFAIGIVAIVAIFTFISIGWLGYLPPIDELQNPINKYATEIYSSDLQLLGRYSKNKENRVKVEYSEISEHVINALIATEDVRFYDHSGIDGKALTRAVILRGIFQKKRNQFKNSEKISNHRNSTHKKSPST